jgi:hypothetical protein
MNAIITVHAATTAAENLPSQKSSLEFIRIDVPLPMSALLPLESCGA